ncbi:MAG: CorA family divalent cation transporter [Actinomycetota bacterium]
MIRISLYRDGARLDDTVDLRRARDILAGQDTFVWLDVADPDDADIDSIGEVLGLHPLTLEDVRHRGQRPRVELFEGYTFVAVRPMRLPDGELQECEVYALVGHRFLATLRYGKDWLDIDRLESRWLRQPRLFAEQPGGSAVYFLLDEVVDGYLSVIEQLEDQADDLEDAVTGDHLPADGPTGQDRMFRLKREVVRLRRVVSPLRQGLDLIQEEPWLVGSELLPYYRDVTEHAIRVAELADNVRDLLTSLLELQVAKEANKLNDTVRTLTAWAGILVVPTLIASIYGMNFTRMPELGWHLGYPFAIALMSAASFALWLMFKRRGWL